MKSRRIRPTKAERAGIRRTRDQLGESGLASLVEFANHEARPWSTLWDGIGTWKIEGEPFTEEAADELQADLAVALNRVLKGKAPWPGPLELRVTYAPDRASTVSLSGPEDDLSDYLQWVLLESVRSGQARLLKRCRHCRRYMLARTARGVFCSPACQDAYFNAQRAATRDANRRRAQKHRAKHRAKLRVKYPHGSRAGGYQTRRVLALPK